MMKVIYIAILLVFNVCTCIAGQQSAPYFYEADHVKELDKATHLSGNVIFKIYDITIHADKVTIQGETPLTSDIVFATNAVFKHEYKKIKSNEGENKAIAEIVRGKAEEMELNVVDRTIKMTGNASFSDGNQYIAGSIINYDIDNHRVDSFVR